LSHDDMTCVTIEHGSWRINNYIRFMKTITNQGEKHGR